MLTKTISQKGLTLIEMMIALVLGLFVTAAIITVFSTNVRTNTENLKMIRLNQELRGAMSLMSDEFKRAGYSALASITTFMDRTNFTTTCANYSYDINANSSVDTVEYYGFRLDQANNEIDWGSGLTNVGCSTGAWQAITDPNIAEITTLDFDITGSVNTSGASGVTALTTTTGVSVYDVTITLTGTTDLPHTSAANDPRRTITETIRIRNEDPKN
ncbi:MAG: type IV pilin [Alteromonas sp. Nap_26]|nr:MAG: type IV pilin [Alteromonas sp. Nap_26]